MFKEKNEEVKIEELFLQAEADGIEVLEMPLQGKKSLSVQAGEDLAIAIDPYGTTTAEEKTMLAHELGHCETLAFYDEQTPPEIRRKYERKADRWAMDKLVPFGAILEAYRDGCREPWELAERFGVTEEMIRKTIERYTG